MPIGSNIIPIDRPTPIDLTSIGEDGEDFVVVEDETDTRSIALTELDISKIQLVTMLKDDETSITGEEHLKRLKASNYIRLDAKVLQAILKNESLVLELWSDWREKKVYDKKSFYVFFDGTVLRKLPRGTRCVPDLYCYEGKCYGYYNRLDLDWYANSLSAVIVH